MFQTRVDAVAFAEVGDESLGVFDTSKGWSVRALGYVLIQMRVLEEEKNPKHHCAWYFKETLGGDLVRGADKGLPRGA